MKLFIPISVIIFFIQCNSTTVITKKVPLETQIYLTDQKIKFTLPSDWILYSSSKKYFQFLAKDPDNLLGPRLEYRGLKNTAKTRKERELYAEGWYKAMELNFPKWRYLEKKYYEVSYHKQVIYTYEFSGEFLDGNVKIKKLGFLRFYQNRIHAIYYTCEEESFDRNLNIFQQIDQRIIYNPYIEPY